MAKQIDDKLVQVLNDEGYFILNVKTIKWGIGILGFVLISLWGFLQKGIYDSNQKSETVNAQLTEIIKRLEETKVDPITYQVYELKGDVKVILDRTNSRWSTNSGTAPLMVTIPNDVVTTIDNSSNLPPIPN
jgi:hypothetical protein